MFTVAQIDQAHEKVKSGADFPSYIQEIKQLGVIGFVTWASDSHTQYFGENDFCTESLALYEPLVIADSYEHEKFVHALKIHQQGETDYYTFCTQTARAGVEKWVVSLRDMTCSYYDKREQLILVEQIPH